MSAAPTPPILPNKMPDAWLEQVRNVFKAQQPTWWVAVLGSSLLASIITSGVALITTVKNIRAGKQLETVKTRLELEKDAFRSHGTAYSNLDKALTLLNQKLQGVVVFVQVANRYPQSEATSKRIAEQVNAAGSAAYDVVIMRQATQFLGNELNIQMDDSMREVCLALDAARQDPQGSLAKIRSADERIKNLPLRLEQERARELSNVR